MATEFREDQRQSLEDSQNQLDLILTLYSDPDLFEAINSSFERLMRNPVKALKESRGDSDVPTIVGSYEQYYFEIAFRFLEDEIRLEVLDIYVGKIR